MIVETVIIRLDFSHGKDYRKKSFENGKRLKIRREAVLNHFPFVIMGRDPVELAKRAKYQPPAMRVRGVCYTKKSPFRYNKVVQADL